MLEPTILDIVDQRCLEHFHGPLVELYIDTCMKMKQTLLPNVNKRPLSKANAI